MVFLILKGVDFVSTGSELLLLHKHIRFCYSEKWCGVPKSNSETYPHDYFSLTSAFNKALEDKFKITEYRGFRKVYDTYLEWLIQKYLDYSFSFDCCYNKKIENKKALAEIYGEQASNMYFLAQTLYFHFSRHREVYSYCFKDEYHHTIVYKMYLAVLKVLDISDYKYISKYDIEQYEKITEEMINHTFKKYIEEYDYLNKKFEQESEEWR